VAYLIGILITIIIILVLYLVSVQSQIRSMSRQLDKRLRENTRQPVSLELINKRLNELAINLNKCFQAEENLRLKGIQEEKKFKEMMANISHDLRTPLTAIKGYQQLLEKSGLTTEQQKKLQIANKHAEELGQLIEQFFEYSYLMNAEPEMQIERINLTNLVTECLVASITSLEENHLEVRFEEEDPVFVMADQVLVTRIVQNLIRNCIQHSDGTIKVRLLQEKEIVISFQNPVKKPEEFDVSKIFDRFYTGDKARSTSTGLGLSIVKLLAQQMGGNTVANLSEGTLEIRVALPNYNPSTL
jgi:signal transduction histidine kinase